MVCSDDNSYFPRVSTKVLPIALVEGSLSYNQTANELRAFTELFEAANNASGYMLKAATCICSRFREYSAEDQIRDRQLITSDLEAHPRLITGYATLLFFIREVG